MIDCLHACQNCSTLYQGTLLSKNDTQKKWQLLREFLNYTESCCKVASIRVNDAILTMASDVADAFNVHFSTSVTVAPSSCYVPPFSRGPQSMFPFPTYAFELFQDQKLQELG